MCQCNIRIIIIKIIKSSRAQPFKGDHLINHIHSHTHHHQQRVCQTYNTHFTLRGKGVLCFTDPHPCRETIPVASWFRAAGLKRM
mmetsp:Transcript_10776/g.22823  ORF Transcript_10776/g.22823 Transcript_10776/m.22823 type:complete len:85 (+) Transcript_10776:107-361(+)